MTYAIPIDSRSGSEAFVSNTTLLHTLTRAATPCQIITATKKRVEADERNHPSSRTNIKPKIKRRYCGLKLHELRHTQATLLLAHGAPIKTVQARLEHADASTTLNIYGHALPEQDHEAALLLKSLLVSRLQVKATLSNEKTRVPKQTFGTHAHFSTQKI